MSELEMYECVECHKFWDADSIEEGTAFADHGDHEGECPSCEGDCHVVDPDDLPTGDDFIEALKNLMLAEGGEPGAEHVHEIARYSAKKLLERVGVRL